MSDRITISLTKPEARFLMDCLYGPSVVHRTAAILFARIKKKLAHLRSVKYDAHP